MARGAGARPRHLAAEAKRRADREAATQARALSLPKVQAQGDVTVTRTEVDVNLPPDLAPSFGGTQTGGRATTSVQAAMPIYDLGNRADATKLRARAAAGEEQFDGEAQGLILRVAQAYFDVAEGEETVASYAAQFDAYELQRRGAQARFDAGKAKITDVREAEAQRDAAQAQRREGLGQAEAGGDVLGHVQDLEGAQPVQALGEHGGEAARGGRLRGSGDEEADRGLRAGLTLEFDGQEQRGLTLHDLLHLGLVAVVALRQGGQLVGELEQQLELLGVGHPGEIVDDLGQGGGHGVVLGHGEPV